MNARLGPYFVWTPYDGAPGWRPLGELFDEDVIAERVAAGNRTLSDMSGMSDLDERAVASIVFLGLASRLLSPPLAAAAVGDTLLEPDAGRLWWRPADSGPLPIASHDLPATACGDQPAADVAETLTRTTNALVEPLLEGFRRRFVLSPQVLWGNVASALGGAAGMIADQAPGHATRAAAIVEAALDLAPLRGAATLVQPDPGHDRWFLVRNNCCLYYRIPGGGTCGDCVLTPQHVREQQWRAKLHGALRSPGDYGGDG